MADYSDPLGLLFGGVDYFGSPQKSQGLLQLTPQEIERMAAAQSPAFGVFPQMQPYRSQQDITASANVPVDVARGRVAGTLGLFGDVFNQPIPMVRPLQLLSQAMTGQQKYPDTEYFLDTLPLKSDTPVGDVAGRIGSFAPINPMPAVRGVQKLGGLLGEEMATRLNTGRPILPSLLAEPQTAMFAVNPAEQAMTSGLLQAEVSPLGFYSAVEQQALKIPRKQGTGESFLNDLLKGQDVKKYEIEAMGLDTYLKGKPNVTRQEVQDFITNNKINVEERQLGGTITEDPLGIASRKAIFDKYEPEIQQLYSELDNVTAKKRNALKLATAKYDDMLLQLNKDGYMPTAQDYEAFNLAEKELTQANRMQNDDIDIRNRLGKIQNIRDAEADAAYVVPESTPTKYEKYQLGGGENYRELLLKLPEQTVTEPSWQVIKPDGTITTGFFTTEEAARRDASYIGGTIRQAAPVSYTTGYRSSHFPDPNILAHMRVNDRVDAEGKKMLLIEEVQSDWHQAGRERGYVNQEAKKALEVESKAIASERNSLVAELSKQEQENGFVSIEGQQRWDKFKEKEDAFKQKSKDFSSQVPDAPFKDTWYQLALKRAIKEAVDKGYDRIGLTTGAQQAERYDLSKQISRVVYSPETEMLNAFDNSNRSVLQRGGIKPDQIENYIGKEPAKKLFEQQNTKLDRRGGKDVSYQEINGVDLQVGGEGMKKYYDEIYPNFLNKYGKKYGAQVGETYINANAKAQTKDQLAKELYGNNETYKNLPSEQKRKVDVMFMDMAKEEKIRYLDITPEMKKAVQKGQPLAAVEGMTGLLA